jgi:hypothetical protein
MAQALDEVKAIYPCSSTDSDCILHYRDSAHVTKKRYSKLATIHVNLDKNANKNKPYWNNRKTLDIYYVKYIHSDKIYRTTCLVDPDGMIKGSFTIRGKGEFGTGNTMDMEISIHTLYPSNIAKKNTVGNWRDYQGKGLSLLLVYFMVECIKTETNNAQKLFIDADGSGGFWHYLGMYNNPLYNNNGNAEGVGYEKVITLGELKAFVKKNKEKINTVLMHGKNHSVSRRSKTRSVSRSPKTRSVSRSPKRNTSSTRRSSRRSTRSKTRSRSRR